MAKKKKLSAAEKEQPPIPGAEQDDKIPEIHNAALAYKQRQQDFSDAGEELESSRLKLVEKMHAHDKTIYRHGNVEVDVKAGKDKVKVKILNAQKDS